MKTLLLCFLIVIPAFADNFPTGLVIPPDWADKTDFVMPDLKNAIPAHWDWREKMGGSVPVWKQECGDCWAHGTAAVANWQAYIHTGQVWMSSRQEILSCSGQGSCGGGFFAHDYQVNHGAGSEADFPYAGNDERCHASPIHSKFKAWHYIGEKYRSPSAAEVKAAIYQYGPVSAIVYANRAMKNYKSGVFDGCSNGGPNHLIVLVGYDDAKGIFYLQNSWGEKWGDKGFMEIPYDCSNVADTAAYVEY